MKIKDIQMTPAWCYIRQSDNVGCFKSLRRPTSMDDWIKGYVLNRKVILSDLYEYSVFISEAGEIWYYRFEATVSFVNPNKFIRNYY